MRWYYKLIEETPTYYRYAYSRESKNYDGIIVYFKETEEVEVELPCSVDKDSEFCMDAAIMHFWYVVDDGFPEERSVCCG